MEGLYEITNALSNGTILDPLQPPLPKIGGSQPQPKTAIVIISGSGEATDCNYVLIDVLTIVNICITQRFQYVLRWNWHDVMRKMSKTTFMLTRFWSFTYEYTVHKAACGLHEILSWSDNVVCPSMPPPALNTTTRIKSSSLNISPGFAADATERTGTEILWHHADKRQPRVDTVNAMVCHLRLTPRLSRCILTSGYMFYAIHVTLIISWNKNKEHLKYINWLSSILCS